MKYWNIDSEIRKELLNDVFREFNGISGMKNITDRLNVGELQQDDTSAKFTAESAKKYMPDISNKSSFK